MSTENNAQISSNRLDNEVDTQHNWLICDTIKTTVSITISNAVMLSVVFFYGHAECRYAECHFA
jgi:hypothetical protein